MNDGKEQEAMLVLVLLELILRQVQLSRNNRHRINGEGKPICRALGGRRRVGQAAELLEEQPARPGPAWADRQDEEIAVLSCGFVDPLQILKRMLRPKPLDDSGAGFLHRHARIGTTVHATVAVTAAGATHAASWGDRAAGGKRSAGNAA